jgi:hypothetical protein
MLTAALIIVSLIFILVLIAYMMRYHKVPAYSHVDAFETASPAKKKVPCILCGSLLEKRENIKSKKYETDRDTMVHIFGCPYCYGDAALRQRTCPVCKKQMRPEGYLIGKMWKTKKGKLHLHVSGCTICAGKK